MRKTWLTCHCCEMLGARALVRMCLFCVQKLTSHFTAATCPVHELVFWALDQGGQRYFHIFKQILWHLGELLEEQLCNRTCEKGSLELAEDPFDEIDTEQLLAQYWQGAADAASRMPLLHLSCQLRHRQEQGAQLRMFCGRLLSPRWHRVVGSAAGPKFARF